MARPDFLKKWASSRVSIPAISDPDYALGFAAYLGSQPPTTDDHDYIMNLQDQRAVWLGEQMLNTVGHVWQSDVTYDAYAVVRSPVNGQLYRSLISSNIGNEPSVSGSKWALGVQPLSTDFLNTTRIDVASAATVNLTSSAPNTRNILITGTTTITAFTIAAGQRYLITFGGALTLTNNASIVTNTGANISVRAGDTCEIRATAANVVEVTLYTRASHDKDRCTAWVNFNGTGTVAIRDSFNVSSITDNGVGRYTVNFATSMNNANYSAVATNSINASATPFISGCHTYATGSVGVEVLSGAGAVTDALNISVQVFGGK